MKKLILTTVLLMTTSVLFSQDLPTITIGTQVWASININASTFNDGSAIQEVKTDYEWNQALLNKKPAWCYYKNETANGDKYGKIYNWYAVNDPRGITPDGFHIPSFEEWNQLVEATGGAQTAGGILKSNNGWEGTGNGNNQSGFNALPGGNRLNNGTFANMNRTATFWTSTEKAEYTAWGASLYHSANLVGINVKNKGAGLYLRLIKN